MADNLLDKASILLTPTAYNDGSMLSVKPENGDGDFTFSRGSAATRVNAQGLVENVQIISSELVSNGDFSQGGQDWTLGTGWSIGDGKVTFNDSSNGDIRTSNSVFTINKKYKIQLTVGGLTSGTAFFGIGDSSAANLVTYDNYDNGDYSFEVVAPNGLELRIYATTSSGSSFFITNISVKEITDDTDLPRIDYTDGCGSWLLEGQSTNLITYSSDYSQSFYIKDSGVSVGTTNNTSPSGDLNATQINVTDNGRIYANISSLTYYSSVFIKAGTFSHFKFLGYNVDLVAQTASGGTIKSYGNGWFRIGVSYTGNRPFQIQAYPDATYSNHSTSGSYYIWGAQVEQQSYATSYIPTNGAIATRLADVPSNSGNSTLINSTEGVLYAEIAALSNDGTNKYITINNGGTTDYIFLRYRSDDDFQIKLRSGNTDKVNQTFTLSNNLDFNKIAFSYKENEFKIFVNGSQVGNTITTGATSAANTLNRVDFSRYDGASKFIGKTKALVVYKEALTDAQLQSLTTI